MMFQKASSSKVLVLKHGQTQRVQETPEQLVSRFGSEGAEGGPRRRHGAGGKDDFKTMYLNTKRGMAGTT